jgi:hypothetical protein
MRSVTCCETSSAVAPGHSVRITMTLNVNGGSSDWPRLRYDQTPASAQTSMKKSTSGRFRSAHSERLNWVMAATRYGC